MLGQDVTDFKANEAGRKIRRGGTGQMPSFKQVRKSATSGYQTERELTRERIFEEFCADRETIAELGVTAAELRELSRASLLGTLTCKEDVLFLLRQMREAMKPAAPASNKLSIPDINKIAEAMRRDALAKLDELDFKAARRRRSALGRIEAVCGLLMMMLNRAQSFVAQISHRLNRRSLSSRPAARLALSEHLEVRHFD
jgi:hypothetical protein